MPADIAESIEDFVVWEERQPARYERLGAVVTMMTGGSWGHGRAILRAGAGLMRRLAGSGCDVTAESVKVVTPARDYLYPDIVVVCGAPVDPHLTVLDRPTLVVEVLSPSTERRDRGPKRLAYFTIPSLRHYLLLSADLALAELFSRDAENAPWRHDGTFTDPGEVIALPALGIILPLADIYEGMAGFTSTALSDDPGR